MTNYGEFQLKQTSHAPYYFDLRKVYNCKIFWTQIAHFNCNKRFVFYLIYLVINYSIEVDLIAVL